MELGVAWVPMMPLPRVRQACNGVGIWCEELIDRLFKEFDEDGSGTIEPDEICDTLLRLLTGVWVVRRGCGGAAPRPLCARVRLQPVPLPPTPS